MWPRPGRAVLAVAVPAQVPLFLVGAPFAGWAIAALGLLLCREDWDLRPGVPAALGVMALLVLGAMAGQSLTVGTAQGPVASLGSPESDTPPLELGLFLAVGAGAAVALAWSTDTPVRRLALAALALLGLVLVFDLLAYDALVNRYEAGSFVVGGGAAFLWPSLLAHGLLLAALAVQPFRGARAWARGLAGAARSRA